MAKTNAPLNTAALAKTEAPSDAIKQGSKNWEATHADIDQTGALAYGGQRIYKRANESYDDLKAAGSWAGDMAGFGKKK